MYAIGLMSGTSLDGIDTALCEIHGYGKDTNIKLIDFQTYDIPEDIKEEIRVVIRNETPTTDLITSLNFKLGYLFSKSVKKILIKNNMSSDEISFVASHGQTIFHIPKDKVNLLRSTLQIGEPSIIAFENSVDVISNFRTMDMAAGGEGAPLVPLSEIIIYGEKDKNIALQNIGGIGNVTLIPGDQQHSSIFAFDTGPGNMVIDEAMKLLFNKPYDEEGRVALSGKVNENLLNQLLEHKYLSMELPKSTGREDFGEQYTKDILKTNVHLKREDIIATLTMFTARTIADAYRRFIMNRLPLHKVIIGGGGAHNKAIVKYLNDLIPEVRVMTQEDIGFSSDAKEAVAFVILGNETYHGRYGNIRGATGAAENVILGNITRNPRNLMERE